MPLAILTTLPGNKAASLLRKKWLWPYLSPLFNHAATLGFTVLGDAGNALLLAHSISITQG